MINGLRFVISQFDRTLHTILHKTRLNFGFPWSNKHHQLKKTPWYLLLGSPKSGKKHFIENSGLRFVKPIYYGRQAQSLIQQFNHLHWYFSDEAVFVDPSEYDENASLSIDRKLIRYLRKQRCRKPMSGIVFTFSLPELILVTHQNRRHFLKTFADQIKNLYQTLKTPIPIYLVFTKVDLISGFSEFFSDLSKEDLSQVWGITFPLKNASHIGSLSAFFQHEYHQLVVRLQQRVLWSLDIEKTQQNRNLIYAFPQQMQLFEKPINTFLNEFFSMLSLHHIIQMRGVYFTSAQQEGQAYDFFLHAIGKHYNLTSNYRISQENLSESYFIQNLFYDVIFSEHAILGFSERTQDMKRWLYRSIAVGAPFCVIFALFAFHFAYKAATIQANLMAAHLQEYHDAMQKLSPSDTESALNALHQAENTIRHSSGWTNILFAMHALKTGITSNNFSQMENTIKTFKALQNCFSIIHSNINTNQAAFHAAVRYMQNNAGNPIRQLNVIADHAPQPLQHWLQQIANNSWELILQGALQYINSVWRADVISQYQRNLFGRYPLAPNAQTQLSIENFQRFFAKEGTLDAFFTRYLKPFINTKSQPWILYTVNGHSLALSMLDLDIFQRIQSIQHFYFDQSQHQPKLRFSIIPLTLDQHDSQVQLNIGTNKILYIHGPQRPIIITWPLIDNTPITKFQLRDFSGHNKIFSSFGDWSLFKLLDQAHLYSASTDHVYIFSMGIDHHNASFKIISDAPIDAFKLVPLKYFSLPTKLGNFSSPKYNNQKQEKNHGEYP